MAQERDLPPLIGQSPSFLEMVEEVSRVAPLDRPVLAIGERGTGKELIAARLHFLSKRWNGPFVKLNCAALSAELLESELFGHEAGAFTGAQRRRIGRFELADGGTLFLDEIANASLPVQEKVLRVSEYGEFERVGGNTTVNVDVRLIGATNVDLPAAAATGQFRQDLLDRLAFDVVTLPPLRYRTEDIPVLTHHFARLFASELALSSVPTFTEAAMQALATYDWPGNVRELKNVVERAAYRATDTTQPIAEINFDPFQSPYRPLARTPKVDAVVPVDAPRPMATAATNLKGAVAEFERRLIEQALEAAKFNQRRAADSLQLTYDQLRNKLRKYRLAGRRAKPDSGR